MGAVESNAALIVERFDLHPPIDIKELVEQFAELEFCQWPFECDGVAVLSDPKPRVFIKSGQPPRRERFTLAHELGHVAIPWHVNAVNCNPSTQNGYYSETVLGVHQEREANTFASHILLPDRFIADFRQHSAQYQRFFQGLNKPIFQQQLDCYQFGVRYSQVMHSAYRISNAQ